jgi:hypothetical protein
MKAKSESFLATIPKQLGRELHCLEILKPATFKTDSAASNISSRFIGSPLEQENLRLLSYKGSAKC